MLPSPHRQKMMRSCPSRKWQQKTQCLSLIEVLTINTPVDYEPKGLKQLVVSNNRLVMALANGHIIRLDLDRPEDLEDIPVVPKKAEDIYKIHLDPTGNHLLISMVNEDVYYLHSSQNKPRQVSHKIRGALISAVAWVCSSHCNS